MPPKSDLNNGIQILPTGQIKVRVTYRDPLSSKRWDKEAILPDTTTMKEAFLKREDMLRALKEKVEDKPRDYTFKEFADKWMKSKEGQWRPATKKLYEDRLKNYINPFLGEYQIKNITNLEIMAYISWLKTSKWAESTQYRTYVQTIEIIKACYDYYGIVDKTKRIKFKPKGLNNPKGTALTKEQVNDLYNLSKTMRLTRTKAVFQIYLLTGMRRLEVAKLKWSDMDLENIHDAWIRPEYTKGLSSTKRDIPLPWFVAQTLKEHKEKEIESIWVFPHRDDPTRAAEGDRGGELINRYSAKLGLDITLHDLRRTFITLLNRDNVNRTYIKNVVGHASPKNDAVHELYIHVTLDDIRVVRRAVEAWIIDP